MRSRIQVLVLCLLALAGAAEAQDYIYQTNDNTITITGYTGAGGDVTIPDTISGLPVTRIADWAFGFTNLTSVTVPDSITNIGLAVFTYSPGLQTITVGPGNPNYSTVDGMLLDKAKTTLVQFPSGKAGTDPIPGSVTRIGASAFSEHADLANFALPANITSLGDAAFSGCNLNSITIPGGLTNMGGWVFFICSGLTNVNIADGAAIIGDLAFGGCTGLRSITIPGSVRRIGRDAFEGCSGLTCVTISNGVSSIGTYAFGYCSALTNIAIPGSVTNIESRVFHSCYRLAAISVDPESLWFASADGVLFDKNQTALIEYPIGKTNKYYTIPSGVTCIGDGAFEQCRRLTWVLIPGSVTNVGNSAFAGSGLTGITIYPGLVTIDDGAFSGCGFAYVSLPAGVTSIGDGAFSSCSALASISIPSTVTNIGKYAFDSCTALASVTIPSGLTTINGWAFDWCTSLTSITIPNGVTSIGWGAFAGCSHLTNVTIPGNVTNIGLNAFSYCSRLTAITVVPSNSFYRSLDGVLFDKGQTTLVQYPGGKSGSYATPNTVIHIATNAFYACAGLTSVTLPSGVTDIADRAFGFCTALAGIFFMGNAPSPGADVFYGDQNATVFFLPGTTGWGPLFGGLPTAPWLPQIQTSDPSFGVRTNQFGFRVTWASGLTVVVEACTNLANCSWWPLQTNQLTDGSCYFADPHWMKYAARFYRIRSP